ncbi:MAG: NAD(P)H-dependent oxidoreductase subunit E [Gammaproteobacteria bacterium]|nr:NAD(P)H-dependent oxidoreductase subunit E [Gammaproteobacteria bacterium]
MSEQTIDRGSVASIAQHYEARPEMLVQILQAIVTEHGWVSEDVIRQLAAILNLSRADVHGVVEYYHDFRTKPPGDHIIKICQAEACQAMGSRDLTRHADSSIDSDTTLEPVYCLGNCACGPAVMVNGKTYGRVNAERFDTLVAAMREKSS